MFESVPAPDCPIDPAGSAHVGVFNTPFARVNMEDAVLRWGGLRMPGSYTRMRLKEWQHFCLLLPELMLGFAVVDAKFLRTSWIHVVDRRRGTHFEHARKGPILDVQLASALWDERTACHARDYDIEVHNHLDGGEHGIRIHVNGAPGKPDVQAELRCVHDLDAIQPLVVVLPVGGGQGMYSHKVPLPLEGSVFVGGEEHVADPAGSLAILDIHKAYYPHRTFWNWATFAGHLADGRPVGLNLTRNVNEDDGRFNENAVWLDGRLHHLGPARFEFDDRDLLAPWRLRTTDGAADLTFDPRGERAEDINLGLVRSSFHQPYGTFSGALQLPGETVQIDDLWGVCEDHHASW